ncbi:IclR family transcriptional regulator [Pseudonocardia sp. HH130630-07]|uniref:IclR family transcriptional regulator n=1 Tax=Pseudonocardia sp. HH130630-07 TaxID=1690815 RepID=UPI000814CE8C|nr:IclR family transcriptional regulator [Pseudonocardia sp. HH130630-07]ANY06633.1 IclR family transcriptional regulator [Pseudonocardia sp. HH130630-07]
MSDAPRTSHGLSRDVDLLEALTSEQARRAGGLGVAQIARVTGREKSQVSRTLRALADAGLVERDADTLAYRLGWRLFSLVARGSDDRLTAAAEPALHRLAVETEQTAHLCVLRDDAVFTVRTVSAHSFRAAGWEGTRAPLACTTAGRMLLSDATPDELYVRFGTVDDLAPARPGARARTVPELWRAIRDAAERGWAEAADELEPGLAGVSAAVRDFRGRVVAAINITGPTGRIGDRLTELGRTTAAAAGAVSAELGWTPGRD